MNVKEKVVYILIIINILGIIIYFTLTNSPPSYIQEYKNKIDALNQKIDSLHHLNLDLNQQVKSLDTQLDSLDIELESKDNIINQLQNEVETQVINVDSFSDNTIKRFFSERYPSF